jgi:copper chaperone CopZ
MYAERGQPRVLSETPGRVRVHLPGWQGEPPNRIEARLRRMPGVKKIQANPLTGNVLVHFDPRATGTEAILAALPRRPEPGSQGGLWAAPSGLLRVGVRGVLGHAAVDALWFGAGFFGQSAGLPLAGLGPLHVLMDVVVWGWVLASAGGASGHRRRMPDRPGGLLREGVGPGHRRDAPRQAHP